MWNRLPQVVLPSALALAAASAGAAPATYELDSEHTTVAFLVAHIGYAKVLGRFDTVAGSYRFDEATGELSDLTVTIGAASAATAHEARDRHIAGPDFLHADRRPEIEYSAAGARRTGERTFEIGGELALNGTKQPVTLHATWNKSGAYPLGDNAYVMGVSARGSLRRSDFGITYALDNGWVGDEVEIMIEIEARRKSE